MNFRLRTLPLSASAGQTATFSHPSTEYYWRPNQGSLQEKCGSSKSTRYFNSPLFGLRGRFSIVKIACPQTNTDPQLQTLTALRDQTRWRDVLTRVLEAGGQRLTNARKPPRKEMCKTKRQTITVKSPPVGVKIGASKVLDRPFARLSGRRRIPKLVNGNRFPFLRLGKPQPRIIGRMIRDTTDKREARLLMEQELLKQLPVAQQEDIWDNILRRKCRLTEESQGEAWTTELRSGMDEIARKQIVAHKKRADIAAKMQAIVEREEALAIEEQRIIQAEKRKQRKIRRLASTGETLQVGKQQELTKSVESESQNPESETTVRDREKFKTKEDIERIRAVNTAARTEEEVADIKAARKKRKEDKSQQKAVQINRKDGNRKHWELTHSKQDSSEKARLQDKTHLSLHELKRKDNGHHKSVDLTTTPLNPAYSAKKATTAQVL